MTASLTIGVLEDARVTGLDGPGLAAAVSRAMHDAAAVVYLANVTASAEGIVACTIAAEADAPLLLTDDTSIPAATRDELQRLGARRVVLVGSAELVDPSVVARLEALGLAVERIEPGDGAWTAVGDRFVAGRLQGSDRIARAIAIAIASLPSSTPMYVALDADAVVVRAPDKVPLPVGRAIDGLSPSIVAVLDED